MVLPSAKCRDTLLQRNNLNRDFLTMLPSLSVATPKRNWNEPFCTFWFFFCCCFFPLPEMITQSHFNTPRTQCKTPQWKTPREYHEWSPSIIFPSISFTHYRQTLQILLYLICPGATRQSIRISWNVHHWGKTSFGVSIAKLWKDTGSVDKVLVLPQCILDTTIV